MRDEYRAVTEIKECLHRFLLGWRALDHIIGDTCQLNDARGDWTLGIGKGRESIDDIAVFDLNSANLGDLVVGRVQTRGLQVEANKGTVERFISMTVDRGAEIVDEVCFRTVDDLDLLAVTL